eukprot:1142314-Pelagomonas_calceolata.AAC.3
MVVAVSVTGLFYTFYTLQQNHDSLCCMPLRAVLFRRLMADYGVPFMVVVWTGLSYSLQSDGNGRSVPSTIPRRVTTPLLWQVTGTRNVTCVRLSEMDAACPPPFLGASKPLGYGKSLVQAVSCVYACVRVCVSETDTASPSPEE